MRLTLIFVTIFICLSTGCQSAPPPQPTQLAPAPVNSQQEAAQSIIIATQPPGTTPQAIEMIDWMMFRYEIVHFAYDSFDLSDASRRVLKNKAEWIKSQDPATQIIVTGHCDQRGSQAYNKQLGAYRANAVKQYLVDCGVPFEQIRIISAGAEYPVVNGEDENAWALNRRAEFLDR